MESTGIDFQSVYAHLEAAGIPALVVNARHVKQVPGRKTDVKDSEWLASLARFGLLRGSFIPPADLRELRLVSRYRQKLVGMLAGEKNRLHKWLDDAGIRLGTVVSDIHGVSAQVIVEGLLDGQSPEELVTHARGRLKAKREALVDSLVVLQMARDHIRFLESRIAELDAYLLAAMRPYEWAFRLLQTLPGVDEVSAAQILIEIGVEMSRFGSAHRLASWAGLCPGNNESAGKRKSGKTRHGTPCSGGCCANWPMPRLELRACFGPSTRAWSCAAVTSAPSSPWPTRCCVPSLCYCHGRWLTMMPALTMKQ